jgi:preprotein translocase subunit SecE
MNAKIAKPAAAASGADIAKYALAAMLLVAGLIGYWVAPWATPLRALLVAGGLGEAGFVFATTVAGRVALEFLGEARFELRKVIWPTRQDSIRATGVIIGVIVVMSIVLAIIDLGLGWLIGKLLS